MGPFGLVAVVAVGSEVRQRGADDTTVGVGVGIFAVGVGDRVVEVEAGIVAEVGEPEIAVVVERVGHNERVMAVPVEEEPGPGGSSPVAREQSGVHRVWEVEMIRSLGP